MMEALDFMWRGGNVVRYHTHPTLRPDYVGHHSYNVACILMVLRPGKPELVVAALQHDMSEWKFGDMPAPAKRALPDYQPGPERVAGATFREVFGELEASAMREAGIGPVEPLLDNAGRWVLKLADTMDGMRYCIQERRMGNAGIVECYDNFQSYAAELLMSYNRQSQDIDLYDLLEKEWLSVSSK